MFITRGEQNVKQEMLSWITEDLIQDAFEAANLGWALDIVSLHDSLNDIAGTADMNNLRFYNSTFNYCLEEKDYQIYIELRNGTRYKIDDINTLINY